MIRIIFVPNDYRQTPAIGWAQPTPDGSYLLSLEQRLGDPGDGEAWALDPDDATTIPPPPRST